MWAIYLLEAAFFGVFVVLFVRLSRSWEKDLPPWQGAWPRVSVLVAARNEEANLARCLDALAALDFPSERLEIWVGNDASEDRTGEIARRYAGRFACIHAMDIEHTMGMARGKANVLAHLARASRGDYLMVCDADIRVNPQWVRSMLAAHQRFGTEAVTGSTVGAPGRSLWVAMQSLEWLYYMSIFKTLDTLGHSTAMGNNMSVRREAYEATGGYEALPFSVTEDYQLYCELMRRGFRHRVVFHAQVRNWSAPLPDWPTLLHQKKRWARGAVQLPPRIRVLMLVHALFFPALLLHAWLDPAEALFIGLDFVLAIWISLGLTARHLRLPVGPAARLVFPFWVMLINLIGPSFALARRKVRWKGREYA